MLIEHYDGASYRDDERPETFDLVTFAHIHPLGPQMFQGPTWQRLLTCHDASARDVDRSMEAELDI
jgi:hypothetical protein